LGYVCEHGLGEAPYAIRLRGVRKSEEKRECVCVCVSLHSNRLRVGLFGLVIFNIQKLSLQEFEVEKSVIHRMWMDAS
jgi:hypothetical protein